MFFWLVKNLINNFYIKFWRSQKRRNYCSSNQIWLFSVSQASLISPGLFVTFPKGIPVGIGQSKSQYSFFLIKKKQKIKTYRKNSEIKRLILLKILQLIRQVADSNRKNFARSIRLNFICFP